MTCAASGSPVLTYPPEASPRGLDVTPDGVRHLNKERFGTEAALVATIDDGLVAVGATLLFLKGSTIESYAALGFILLALLFIQMMVSPLYWLLMSEIFPMRVCEVLTGLSVSSPWIFNATVAFLFPLFLHAIGPGTFFVFATINILSLCFVARFLPETKGLSLEKLEAHLQNHFSTETQEYKNPTDREAFTATARSSAGG